MLNINIIRSQKNTIEQALAKRMPEGSLDLDSILALDEERRSLQAEIDALRTERNKHSKSKPDPDTIEKMKAIGKQIAEKEKIFRKVENAFVLKLAELPNIPADDVPAGGKENNQVLRQFGKKLEFKFEAKDHVQLAESLGIIDYERGAKIAGSGFWAYKDEGAVLEWSLLNYFVDFHRKNKYSFLLLPFLLNEDSAYASGKLPKFRDELYWTQDKLCLSATSEMSINNFHRDEILDAKTLPLKYFSYSACFRREAGSYRKEERGMVRGHQFNKIEMFQFAKPEQSWDAFEELTKNAEKLIDGLGLHFQSTLLAAGDTTDAMSKTIDLEVWIPSMGVYKEVSSSSNALDYQARRSNIRYKDENNENLFVHTLNASGLATSRLIPAILEQFQQADGSVKIPKVLQKYTGFKSLITKKQ